MTKPILLVGAAGWLGGQIADELLDRGASLRVLLRGGTAHAKAADLSARKAEIAGGDLTDAASLDAATKGIGVIVSAVQGGPDVIIAGQAALAAAGMRNGVSRMIPSDYSADFRGITTAGHLFLGWREEADRAIAAAGMPQTNVFNGAFLEMLTAPFFGMVDTGASRVRFWGSADQLYDFTGTADVASYVAALALDDDAPRGAFEVAGDTKSPRQIADIFTKTASRTFTLEALGTLSDLDAELARRQAAAPDDPMQWAALQYHRIMASGRGKLKSIANARYPSISPSTVEMFAKSAAVRT
jgi:uncharacterized protein YbjT (DUF2867 family)